MIERSIIIVMRDTPCAHSCRYCNMGSRKRYVKVPRARRNALLERFITWQAQAGEGLSIAVASGYSDEAPRREPENAVRETERLNGVLLTRRGVLERRMHLGGLKMRSPEETRVLMQARYEAGYRFANASYAGVYEIHDYWNRREGDFLHLLQLQRIAVEVGMNLGQYLFVAQNTLPHLEQLLDLLNALPRPAVERAAILFGYIGSAREHEAQRITEAHRERLPDRIRALIPPHAQWKSEREWMATEQGEDSRIPQRMWLFVDETNIDWLEATPCADILADLEEKTSAAHRALPSWAELRDRHGDPDGHSIYASGEEIARKWLDRHLEQHPIAFERRLTHLRATY
ncbi:MAG: hypothetical protein WDO56_05275 [Gammaproteobacteria bacterium]